jgi:2-oxoglutarate ferredoxin oxidoreductase subunit alpha
MLAEGALDAGCGFFAGYPITPASEIYETMMRELPARGGLALSAPDEISALCYCVGASLRGLKVMTATSGPGWALMIETLQYALMTETPAVIALVQRLGPSTGGATQGGQGDLWSAAFAVSGGYSVPVFAPSDAVECYQLAVHAFDWSERLRTPVVVLSDKEVAMTIDTVDTDALRPAVVATRRSHVGAAPFVPYAFETPDEPPPFAPVGGATKVTATGSAHDRSGRLRKNDPEVLDVLRHLERKIAAHADEMARTGEDLDPRAELLLVSWGVTARAARAALAELRRSGLRVSLFQPLTLLPLPRRALARALEGVRSVVVAEENLGGQYRLLLAPWLDGRRSVGVNGIGRMISPGEIVAAVRAEVGGWR